MQEKPKNISVNIVVEFVHTVLCDVQAFNESFMDEEVDPILVPAAPSYVEALKTKQYDKENSKEESCSVCYQEFLMAEDVTLMPCSHIFHNNCIGRWLEMTNTCPMCRFTMPTFV
ncbi:hypothetical protein AQUCO_00300448v1 [Aquilegia coerulea]|uniref:RING-type E3 ubiquitin transferase n=1 Tax=Aquilegia coerulea TaxID=218851 RepID=A0A2G5EYV8_AQUCA|nr:hypothetical protein AQUCO_00300448v1 [Aquilegia coerulea]